MEPFTGLSMKQIQCSLLRFNKLKRIGRKDMYCSTSYTDSIVKGSIVIGPTAMRIYRNLAGETIKVYINLKLFNSLELQQAVTAKKKICIIVHYVVMTDGQPNRHHGGLIYIDPCDQDARYIDCLTSSFVKKNVETLNTHIPWNLLGAKKPLKLFIFKYLDGIENSCALRCLHAIKSLVFYESFSMACKQELFLSPVGWLNNKIMTVKTPQAVFDKIFYEKMLLNCLNMLIDQKICPAVQCSLNSLYS